MFSDEFTFLATKAVECGGGWGIPGSSGYSAPDLIQKHAKDSSDSKKIFMLSSAADSSN